MYITWNYCINCKKAIENAGLSTVLMGILFISSVGTGGYFTYKNV